MTTTIVYADATDGDLASTGASAATAYAGAGLTADTTGDMRVGAWFTGSYFASESFVQFNTSPIPDTDVISAVVLELWPTIAAGTNFTIGVWVFDWGAGLTTADWRTTAQLVALTEVATRSTSGMTIGGYRAFTETGSAFRSAIDATGQTKLVLADTRHETGTAPTNNNTFVDVASADTSGTANDPKLTVTHTGAVLGVLAGAWGAWAGTVAGVRTVSGVAVGAWGAWAGTADGVVTPATPRADGAWSGWVGAAAGIVERAGVAVGAWGAWGATAGGVTYSVEGPTVDDVLDVRAGQVQVSWVFVLVDRSGEEIGRLTPLRAPSISHDTDRRIYRQLTDFVIPPAEQADVNVLTDRVRVGMVVAGIPQGEPGHVDTPLPWGEFVFDGRPRQVASWGEMWHGSLLDLSAILDDPLPNGVSYPTGYSLADLLAEQFEAALISRYDIELPQALTLSAGVSATVGTSRLEFMRQVASLGACGLWSANSGRGRVAAIPVGDPDAPELAYVYGRNIAAGGVLLDDTKLRVPNRWLVIDTTSGTVGQADLLPSSPNSATRRGRTITAPPRNVQGIPGDTDAERQINADAIAAFDSLQDRNVDETASFDGAIDPRHDTFDLVALFGETYLEHAWGARLENGALMSHDLRRTYG